MNIQKVQKLNNLAIHLKQHNLLSKDDAVKQAESIYGKEHNYMGDTMTDQQSNVEKDVRKMGFALQSAIKEINDLKRQVSSLQRELNDVRVNAPKQAPVSNRPVSPAPVAPAPSAPQPASPQPVLPPVAPGPSMPASKVVSEEPATLTPTQQIAQESVQHKAADVSQAQNAPKVQSNAPIQQAPQVVSAQQETSKKDAPVDRNGIAPEDVSIEKYFYFGQK